MTLKEQITEDMKKYMREKDSVSLNAVRMLKSEIKNAEIAAIKELDDDGVIKVVQSSIKKRKDAAELYSNANRQELADKELAEIKALEKYLPAQLSEAELEAIIKDTIAKLEPDKQKNVGIVTKMVMAQVTGKADGRTVNGMIKRII